MSSAFFRFYADLNDFLPAHKKQRLSPHPVHDGNQTVKHLIEAQGIPHTEVDLILVDGTAVGFEHCVHAGEYISVYPPWMTLDPAPRRNLRPPLPQPVRFLLDNHLGRLARTLRLLGIDALYFNNQLDDEQLADLSHNEQRVLLSRDRGLLKRGRVIYGYCLRTTDSRAQLIAVIRRFQLADHLDPWSRCLRCNGMLEPAVKENIMDRLEPKTRRYFDEFQQCLSCRQPYWRGSHFIHLQRFVESIQNEFT